MVLYIVFSPVVVLFLVPCFGLALFAAATVLLRLFIASVTSDLFVSAASFAAAASAASAAAFAASAVLIFEIRR